jgi:hypothetical protein
MENALLGGVILNPEFRMDKKVFVIINNYNFM